MKVCPRCDWNAAVKGRDCTAFLLPSPEFPLLLLCHTCGTHFTPTPQGMLEQVSVDELLEYRRFSS